MRTDTEQARESWRSWRSWAPVVHRALGFGPLLLFAIYHLWAQWPALYGRDAWLARAQRYGLGNGLGALVIALFAGHAVLGVFRQDAHAAAESGESPGRRRFQSFTGIAIALFTAYHLTHVWPRPDGAVATLARSYERLWQQLGQPVVLGAYVLGCAALAGHAAHAIVRLLEPRIPQRARAALTLASGLGGFTLFALYLQLLAQYAAGEPMLPGKVADVAQLFGM